MAKDINALQRLAKNIKEFVDYDETLKKAEQLNLCMKEEKDLYEQLVLKGIKEIFQDLPEEEIFAILLECVAYVEVKDAQE